MQVPIVSFAVVDSFWPAPHVVCVAHVVLRCEVEDWYVLAPQLEHVRAAVLESAEIFLPAPHVVCVAHEVLRCEVEDWYVLASQLAHV
jgi:extradiol dioxygenase family protein